MKGIIEQEFHEHLNIANLLHHLTDEVAKSAQLCIDTLNNHGKILLFGNGGSAADAQHIAAELVGRYKHNRIGLPAIALTTDSSSITSIANDYGYENVFNRQVEALANKGDVVIGISTSGESINVISALKTAQKLHCNTIGFSGNNGKVMQKICNINLAVPSDDTPRVQEMHILLGHTICKLIDNAFSN